MFHGDVSRMNSEPMRSVPLTPIPPRNAEATPCLAAGGWLLRQRANTQPPKFEGAAFTDPRDRLVLAEMFVEWR